MEHSGFHEYKDGQRFNPDCPACSEEDYRSKWIKAVYETMGWAKPEQLLTPEEYIKGIVAAYGSEVMALVQKGELDKLPTLTNQATAEIEAQLAQDFTRLKNALKQSRKGEPIDLSEEWFELFSAIQNSGIAKKHRPDREEIARTPITTHRYKGKRYLTLDSIDQLLALFEEEKCHYLCRDYCIDDKGYSPSSCPIVGKCIDEEEK